MIISADLTQRQPYAQNRFTENGAMPQQPAAQMLNLLLSLKHVLAELEEECGPNPALETLMSSIANWATQGMDPSAASQSPSSCAGAPQSEDWLSLLPPSAPGSADTDPDAARFAQPDALTGARGASDAEYQPSGASFDRDPQPTSYDRPEMAFPISNPAPPPSQAPDQRASAPPTPVEPSRDITVSPSGGAPGDRVGPIGAGSRVLMIGDSHTAGRFGRDMDALLRRTGATVQTYGSSSAVPSWFTDGTPTRWGFWGHHENGSVDAPADWRQPHATPRIQDIIARDHPDTMLVALGANMRTRSADQIRQQVDDIAGVARRNNVRLIWIGPPRQRGDESNPSTLDRFYGNLQQALTPYGARLIDSRPYTPRYVGSDSAGVHYTGAAGQAAADRWAQGVFGAIQGD